MRTKIQEIARNLKQEVAVYRLVLRHPRTPALAKVLLGAALAYLMLPFDLIPDFLPVIGHLDDAIIVPGLIAFGLRAVPADVMAECRATARAAATPDPAKAIEGLGK